MSTAVRHRNLSAVQVLPPGAPRHLWLRERETSMGGSDAAAAVGESRFCSPYQLWLIKTGRMVVAETAQMRAGTLLEPMTVGLFEAESGLDCTPAGMWRTPAMPWQHANPDRFTSDGHGLECKATFGFAARDWADGPSSHAVVQSQWYMHVTGLTRWYIAVLTDGWKLDWWFMDRDQRLIDALAEQVAEFWHEHILTDVPPPVDGSERTRLAIRATYGYAHAAGTSVEIPGLRELVAERRECKDAIAYLTGQLTGVENKIKAALGDHHHGTEDGERLISWQARTTTNDLRYLQEPS